MQEVLPSVEKLTSGTEGTSVVLPPAAGLEEEKRSGFNARGVHDGVFEIDQLPVKAALPHRSTAQLEESTFQAPPFSEAVAQANATQPRMATTNPTFNPTDSLPKKSPATPPANRIFAKSDSIFDRAERLPSVNIFAINSNLLQSRLSVNQFAATSGMRRWNRLRAGLEQAPGGVRVIGGKTFLVDLRQTKLFTGIRLLDWVGIPTGTVSRNGVEHIRLSRMKQEEIQETFNRVQAGDVLFIDETQELDQIPLEVRERLTIVRLSAREAEGLTQQKVEALIRAAEQASGRNLHIRSVTMTGLSEDSRYSLAVITGT